VLSSTPVISTSDLGVRFGDHAVLDDVTFEAEAGDFVAVVGPNGAGKTTLIRVLLGLVTPDTGWAHVFGRRPSAVEPGLVGYVPQVKRLDRTFPARAIDLVLTALHQRWPFSIRSEERARALNALSRVGAESLAERSLDGLSGGELQRVYLARSLARMPRLILLDEPATGIDVAGAADLYDVLEDDQAGRDTTLLMVTHDWNAAYHHATRVLLIDGRQVGFGSPQEVLTDACLREAFGHTGHAHAMLTNP
jgi:zinc transport system ATP-binding protein